MPNPETILTHRLKAWLVEQDAYVIKLSDRFSIGVPDLAIVTSRIIFVEVKVLRGQPPPIITYEKLGLSGAQDQRLREAARREPRSAFVVSGEPSHGPFAVWIPVHPESQGPGFNFYTRLSLEDGCPALL